MLNNKVLLEINGPKANRVPVVVFDNGVSQTVAKGILEGTSYPIVPFVKSVNTIIDIGANVGLSAIWFSRKYPASRVLAIEPSPNAFALLAQNSRHWPRIEPYNLGLHSEKRTATMFLSTVDSVTNSIGRSAHNTKNTIKIELEDVELFLQSKSVDSIDILKIDTEGCEVPILDRIRARLPQIRVIYIEYHSEADRRWIDDLLAPTHVLRFGHVLHEHRGEFCYVARSAYSPPQEADRFEIRM